VITQDRLMVGKSRVCNFLTVRHLLGDGIESSPDVFGERRDGLAEPLHLDIEPATLRVDSLGQFLEPGIDTLSQFLQLAVETATVSVQFFFEYRHSRNEVIDTPLNAFQSLR